MVRVRLLEDRPFMFKDVVTFYKKGDMFEVVETRNMPMMGLGYKIKCLKFNCVLDGFNSAKDFGGE